MLLMTIVLSGTSYTLFACIWICAAAAPCRSRPLRAEKWPLMTQCESERKRRWKTSRAWRCFPFRCQQRALLRQVRFGKGLINLFCITAANRFVKKTVTTVKCEKTVESLCCVAVPLQYWYNLSWNQCNIERLYQYHQRCIDYYLYYCK